MLPMAEIWDSLSNINFEKIHVVAVAGHNEVLRKKLSTVASSRLAALGFTDDMPQLMQAADVVITKAGGVSLAECLACGANILVYHPLPGQEQANAAFLQKEYGVAAVEDIRQLHTFLEKEMRIPLSERLQRQARRRKSFGHPEAAERIAVFTEKLRRPDSGNTD